MQAVLIAALLAAGGLGTQPESGPRGEIVVLDTNGNPVEWGPVPPDLIEAVQGGLDPFGDESDDEDEEDRVKPVPGKGGGYYAEHEGRQTARR